MSTPKVTLGRILDVFELAKKSYNFINKETQISWVFYVDESNIDMLKSLKADPPLGSIIFGIEWVDEEGYLCKGTLYVEPEPTSNIIN